MKLSDLDKVKTLSYMRDEIGAFLEKMTKSPDKLIRVGHGWYGGSGQLTLPMPAEALAIIRDRALAKLEEVDGQLKALGVELDRGPNEDADDDESDLVDEDEDEDENYAMSFNEAGRPQGDVAV